MELNYEPFKEPRGFLKVLQWLFAICAFATTVNFTATPSGELICNVKGDNGTVTNQTIQTVSHIIEYPFDLDHEEAMKTLTPCNRTLDKPLECSLIGNAKSDSQFFVTTGVLTFLFTTGMIAVYLIADRRYTENPRAPVMDFFITLVFAVFWLSGSAAWLNGLSAVTAGSNPRNWQLVLTNKGNNTIAEFCNTLLTGFECGKILEGSFGGLVISILFGFINFILWAANLWFLYKETTWFDGIMKNSSNNPGSSGV